MRELVERIHDYFDKGGLFNPEAMDHDKVRQLLLDCREALASLPEWVPCSERLPWVFSNVLFFTPSGPNKCEILMGAYTDMGFYANWEGNPVNNVTHWMPLPTPPGEEA